MASTLFEDIFDVRALNPEGKKFDKVTRIVCKGVSYEMDLTLDINSEIFPMKNSEKFTLALASTLDLDGKPETNEFDQSGKPSLLDRYEYGMYGKVFKYEYEAGQRIVIYASFGGLLMCLKGEQRHLNLIHNDSRIYCLIRRQ